mmetsp:Transcript_46560/g.123629  ORF Transcript_46560/g.123629 Transcript_46560/m.123629 type:complete len:320 (+) Transcript_46560:1-960(+)
MLHGARGLPSRHAADRAAGASGSRCRWADAGMFRGRCRLRPGAHGPVLLVRVPEAALDGPAGGRAPARAGCHLRRPGRHRARRDLHPDGRREAAAAAGPIPGDPGLCGLNVAMRGAAGLLPQPPDHPHIRVPVPRCARCRERVLEGRLRPGEARGGPERYPGPSFAALRVRGPERHACGRRDAAAGCRQDPPADADGHGWPGRRGGCEIQWPRAHGAAHPSRGGRRRPLPRHGARAPDRGPVRSDVLGHLRGGEAIVERPGPVTRARAPALSAFPCVFLQIQFDTYSARVAPVRMRWVAFCVRPPVFCTLRYTVRCGEA